MDLQATKASDLWPKTGQPSKICNFGSIWTAINVHLPALEGKKSKDTPSIIDSKKNDQFLLKKTSQIK